MLGTTITGLDNDAKEALLQYNWPGNVRELKNILERAMTFAEHGKIQLEDLPDYMLKTLPEKKTGPVHFTCRKCRTGNDKKGAV